MINALTADGEVHFPSAGPPGPTTACGRTEQVYVIDHYVTCSECNQRVTVLPPEVFDELAEGLDRPPQPNEKMIELMRRTRGGIEHR